MTSKDFDWVYSVDFIGPVPLDLIEEELARLRKNPVTVEAYGDNLPDLALRMARGNYESSLRICVQYAHAFRVPFSQVFPIFNSVTGDIVGAGWENPTFKEASDG